MQPRAVRGLTVVVLGGVRSLGGVRALGRVRLVRLGGVRLVRLGGVRALRGLRLVRLGGVRHVLWCSMDPRQRVSTTSAALWIFVFLEWDRTWERQFPFCLSSHTFLSPFPGLRVFHSPLRDEWRRISNRTRAGEFALPSVRLPPLFFFFSRASPSSLAGAAAGVGSFKEGLAPWHGRASPPSPHNPSSTPPQPAKVQLREKKKTSAASASPLFFATHLLLSPLLLS